MQNKKCKKKYFCLFSYQPCETLLKSETGSISWYGSGRIRNETRSITWYGSGGSVTKTRSITSYGSGRIRNRITAVKLWCNTILTIASKFKNFIITDQLTCPPKESWSLISSALGMVFLGLRKPSRNGFSLNWCVWKDSNIWLRSLSTKLISMRHGLVARRRCLVLRFIT